MDGVITAFFLVCLTLHWYWHHHRSRFPLHPHPHRSRCADSQADNNNPETPRTTPRLLLPADDYTDTYMLPAGAKAALLIGWFGVCPSA